MPNRVFADRLKVARNTNQNWNGCIYYAGILVRQEVSRIERLREIFCDGVGHIDGLCLIAASFNAIKNDGIFKLCAVIASGLIHGAKFHCGIAMIEHEIVCAVWIFKPKRTERCSSSTIALVDPKFSASRKDH